MRVPLAPRRPTSALAFASRAAMPPRTIRRLYSAHRVQRASSVSLTCEPKTSISSRTSIVRSCVT